MHFYYLIFFFLVLILQSWRWKLCWIRLFVLCQLCLLAHLDPLSRKIFCGWGRIGDQHHSVMNTSVRVNCQILLPRMNKNMSGPYIILWLWEKKFWIQALESTFSEWKTSHYGWERIGWKIRASLSAWLPKMSWSWFTFVI